LGPHRVELLLERMLTKLDGRVAERDRLKREPPPFQPTYASGTRDICPAMALTAL
jgi:hypothetical protein